MITKILSSMTLVIFFSLNPLYSSTSQKKDQDFSKLLEEKLKKKSEFEFEQFQQDQRLNSGPAADRAKFRINAASTNLPIIQQDAAHSGK